MKQKVYIVKMAATVTEDLAVLATSEDDAKVIARTFYKGTENKILSHDNLPLQVSRPRVISVTEGELSS